MHGLESNSNSSLAIDMSQACNRLGYTVACINNRGCSGENNLRLGMYHAGFTDDLKQFLSILRETANHPLYLSGFSLGANIVLKILGELGLEASTKYNIQGAAVTGAPFDMERNMHVVDAPGFNRAVYAGNFLENNEAKKSKEKLRIHCDNDPDTTVFDYKGCMQAETIAQVENSWLARIHNIDYYRKVSCGNFLERIAVPTLIINAGDDPFFDPLYFPNEIGCDGDGIAPITMIRTEHGGHLGYLFHRRQKDEVPTKPRKDDGSGAGFDRALLAETEPSWMPTELARFIEHVHDISMCC